MKVDKRILMSKQVLKGLTQTDVAEMLGVTLGTYSNKLNGRSFFTDDEKVALAGILSLSLEEMNEAFYEGRLPVEKITVPIIKSEEVVENGT